MTHVRYLAWLQAVPESPRPKKAERGAMLQPPSRIEAMGERADDLEYPPCDAGYLVKYLFDVGPVEAGGMGPVPLSHTEIEAWQRNTGIELSRWEACTLRDLSKAYLAMSQDATHPSCPPPWTPQGVEEKRKGVNVAQRVKDALRG